MQANGEHFQQGSAVKEGSDGLRVADGGFSHCAETRFHVIQPGRNFHMTAAGQPGPGAGMHRKGDSGAVGPGAGWRFQPGGAGRRGEEKTGIFR